MTAKGVTSGLGQTDMWASSGCTHLLVMEVIVRLRDRALCASITCITGTYAEPEGRVIFDHRHNAAYSAPDQMLAVAGQAARSRCQGAVIRRRLRASRAPRRVCDRDGYG